MRQVSTDTGMPYRPSLGPGVAPRIIVEGIGLIRCLYDGTKTPMHTPFVDVGSQLLCSLVNDKAGERDRGGGDPR